MDSKADRYCYIAGWCIIGAAVILILMEKNTGFALSEKIPPCMFHQITGFYCPGCGGTRAVRALLSGDILRSLSYHPIVCYAAAVGGWFMLSQTIERVTNGRIPIGMHYRDCYLWIALGIICVHFIVSNAFL